MPYERDTIYYCQDLVLLVENTLFRVPRFIFQHSEVFQDMLSVPQGDEGTLEGTDDDHPLILPSYLAQDFQQLLKVLLPRQDPPGKPELTPEEWMSVLKLATVWNFESARQMAYGELEACSAADPILRLIVAKRFNFPLWFVPAINALAEREAPLDETDCDRLLELGDPRAIFKFILKIAKVREGFRPWSAPNCHNEGEAGWCNAHDKPLRYCPSAEELIGRGSHYFIDAIKDVFDCEYEDPGPDAAEGYEAPLLPKPSSWDFS